MWKEIKQLQNIEGILYEGPVLIKLHKISTRGEMKNYRLKCSNIYLLTKITTDTT